MVIQYIELGEQFTDRQIEREWEKEIERQTEETESETGQFIAIESRRGLLVCVCVRVFICLLST